MIECPARPEVAADVGSVPVDASRSAPLTDDDLVAAAATQLDGNGVAIAERVVDHRPLPYTRPDTRDGDLHAIGGSLEGLAAVEGRFFTWRRS